MELMDELTLKDNGNYSYTTERGSTLTIYKAKDETGYPTGFWSWVVVSSDDKRKVFSTVEEYDIESSVIDAVVSIPIVELEELYKEEIGL